MLVKVKTLSWAYLTHLRFGQKKSHKKVSKVSPPLLLNRKTRILTYIFSHKKLQWRSYPITPAQSKVLIFYNILLWRHPLQQSYINKNRICSQAAKSWKKDVAWILILLDLFVFEWVGINFVFWQPFFGRPSFLAAS